MNFFFFSSRRRHTRFDCDWSSDVCSSDLVLGYGTWGMGRGSRMRRGFTTAGLHSSVVDRIVIGAFPSNRESVVWGKRVGFGGRRIIKKKKNKTNAYVRTNSTR